MTGVQTCALPICLNRYAGLFCIKRSSEDIAKTVSALARNDSLYEYAKALCSGDSARGNQETKGNQDNLGYQDNLGNQDNQGNHDEK